MDINSWLATKLQTLHGLPEDFMHSPLPVLLAGSELQSKLTWWLLGGICTVVVLRLLMELSRSICRTPMEAARLLVQFSSTISKTLVQFVARGFNPQFPNWTLRFELVRGIMRDVSNMFGERIVDKHHAPIFRLHSEFFGSFLGWFALKLQGLHLETVQLNGLEHLWLKSSPTELSTSSDTNRTRLVVLFYHGGGYAVLSPRMYIPFGCTLVTAIKQALASSTAGKDVDVDVFLANYRKVPEYQFPVPVEDAVCMYEYLLQHEHLEPSQIILAGDSAGGGLVMSTLLRVRDGKSSWKPKLPLPLAAIVACPFVDLTGDEDPSHGQQCALSPGMISACIHSYHPTREDPKTWADASPVQCDLTGLPPVLLQAATFDYLFQHSLRLAAKAKADGVTNWEVDVHEGVPHVFMVFPEFVLPYARVGIQRMAAFAVKQFLGAITIDHKDSATGEAPPRTEQGNGNEIASENVPRAA